MTSFDSGGARPRRELGSVSVVGHSPRSRMYPLPRRPQGIYQVFFCFLNPNSYGPLLRKIGRIYFEKKNNNTRLPSGWTEWTILG